MRKSRGRRGGLNLPYGLITVIFLSAPVFVLAQDPAAVNPAVTQEQVSLPAQEQANDKVTMDLKGVDINEFFKMLSEKCGMTIITTSEVKGRITVLMDNLSFNDALDVVVTMQNLAYEKKGNIVKVMSADEYEKSYGKKFGEKKKTHTIKLAYAKPANVMTVISSLKSDLGKIIADEASGTIIITDTPPAMATIEDAIKEIDKPLESEVFNINYARFADLKGYLNDLITPGVGQIIVDERSSKVVVTDLPQRLNKIRKLMAELDEQSREVLITGEIIEVTIDDKFQSGIQWDKLFAQAGMGNLNLMGNFPVAPALSSYGKISIGSVAKGQNDVVLNLLNDYGVTKILTRPRIVAVNKEEAKILVGTREAYVVASQSQGQSTTITSDSVQFIDVGIKLSIVPTIGSDGFITMKIKPEVSSVARTITTDSGTQVPIVETSQSETVVKIKDGTTLIIAGLMKNTDTNDSTGLPKLSRLPVLGSLFGNKTKEKARTELVIFITPTIITGADNTLREGENEKQ